MREKRAKALFGASVLLTLVAGIGAYAHGERQAAGPTSDQERGQLLVKGKEIFVEKCAKCHNERGDKALSSGKPLNERGLTTEAIARAVSGRLKDRTEGERRAVTLYIASLMNEKGSEQH